MSKHVTTTIRYDGPALAGHEMDVQDLAPALLALAEIAQIANRKFNGDRASLKVLVNADVEQQCFMLDLSMIQSLIELRNYGDSCNIPLFNHRLPPFALTSVPLYLHHPC